MTASHPTSRPTRVAFQGDRGAFGEEAVRRLWPAAVEPVACPAWDDVARAVATGAADAAVLPIENTLAGRVAASTDALIAGELHVIGETVLAIHQCLLGVAGATPSAITRVDSHPVALAQCAAFLRRHPHLEGRAATNTAVAAREVAAAGDPARAAIAGRAAADAYGLVVLAADIEDRHDNQTRFWAVAPHPRAPAAGSPAKTALVVTTPNVSGSLLRVLTPIADAGLNLCALDARPTGEPWSYRFVLEIEHAAGDDRMARAVEAIRGVSLAVRRLGTFATGAQ